MASEYIVFSLTSTIALYALVVFVFAFVKLKATNLKDIFRLYFFSTLIFAVGQIVLLMSTLLRGFDFDLFLNINAVFSFGISIVLIVLIVEAEVFSKQILAEAEKNGN